MEGFPAADRAAQKPNGSPWSVRRARQLEARHIAEGKLLSALARVADLEEQVRSFQAEQAQAEQRHRDAAEQALAMSPIAGACGPKVLRDEVAERLAMAAPLLEQGLAIAGSHGGACRGIAKTMERKRRNTASHNFHVPAATIRRMTGSQLNAVQRARAPLRRARSTRPRAYRRQPSARAPADKVPDEWDVVTGRGRSKPRSGCQFDLAVRAREAIPDPAVISGPLYFAASADEQEGEKVGSEKHKEPKESAKQEESEEAEASSEEHTNVQDTASQKEDSLPHVIDEDTLLDEVVAMVEEEQTLQLEAENASLRGKLAEHAKRAEPARCLVEKVQSRNKLPCQCQLGGELQLLQAHSYLEAPRDVDCDRVRCNQCRRGIRELQAMAVCFTCRIALCAPCMLRIGPDEGDAKEEVDGFIISE